MIVKTEALVLQITPHANTSRIVTWLTPDSGRLTTIIKGACRPKSPFLGTFDYFYTCELLYYARPHDGLCIARDCAPLRTRARFRQDWRACACASYLTQLAHHSSVGGDQHRLFDLTEAALDLLADGGPSLPLLFWVELRLLALLGVNPQMEACARCRGPLDAAGSLAFSERAGGLLCASCRTPSDRATAIGPDLVALIRRWQEAGRFSELRNLRLSARQTLDFQRLLGVFMAYHLDTPAVCRDLACTLAVATPAGSAPGGRLPTSP